MDYPALSRRNHQLEEIRTWYELVNEIITLIKFLFDIFIGLPINILQQLGINIIPNIFSINTPLISICICGAMLGITASIGIGLGVGLGVGLNCAQTQYIHNSSALANGTSSGAYIFGFAPTSG